MYRIVHIHSDFKFISEISKYEAEDFQNILIFLGEKNEKNSKYHESGIFLIPNNDNLTIILNYCLKADLVVLNDLDTYKCKIVSILPKNLIIAWRFFGYELYGKRLKHVLSPKTFKIINVENRKNIFQVVRDNIIKIRTRILLSSVMQRINFFLGMYHEEYQNLKSYWKNLPNYINILVYDEKTEINHYAKENFFILGNNRSAYNNHIDIIDIILKRKVSDNMKGKLFFNYGEVNKYSETIRSVVNRYPNYFELIEEFLTIEQFEEVYKNASAFVLNSYRQMALSNIFTALKYGVKIYLNIQNDTFDWLKKNDFIIFTINDFSKDYFNNNLRLQEKEALHNMEQLNNLFEQNKPLIFQKELRRLLDKELNKWCSIDKS